MNRSKNGLQDDDELSSMAWKKSRKGYIHSKQIENKTYFYNSLGC